MSNAAVHNGQNAWVWHWSIAKRKLLGSKKKGAKRERAHERSATRGRLRKSLRKRRWREGRGTARTPPQPPGPASALKRREGERKRDRTRENENERERGMEGRAEERSGVGKVGLRVGLVRLGKGLWEHQSFPF